MALGALANITGAAATSHPGPVMIESKTLLGDGAYATGGTTGLKQKLKDLMKDGRELVAAWGFTTSGKTCRWNPADDKLLCFQANGTEESAAADLSAVSYVMTLISK